MIFMYAKYLIGLFMNFKLIEVKKLCKMLVILFMNHNGRLPISAVIRYSNSHG